MIIHSDFETDDGQSLTFRRVPTDKAYSGTPGLFAFVHTENLSVEALMFKAANDLVCIDACSLKTDKAFVRLSGRYKVGVAVLVMPNSTKKQRDGLAQSLNRALTDGAKAA